MKNLYNLDAFNEKEVLEVVELATKYKNGEKKDYSDIKVVNLFFEPSTRTHYSFVSAQNNFNMKTTNVNLEYSSTQKGETLYDTIKTFEAIGYDMAVIRHPQNNYYKELENINIPVLSGGDGTGNHPTQSLLDLMTIYEKFKKFKGLKVVIMGDVMHSRVAHTNIKIMEKLGMEVYISGPSEFNDGTAKYLEFEEALEQVDVVMLLRVQFERHGYQMTLTKEEYHEKYGMNEERVRKMKDEAIIMHPAPFNRGTEIADEIVECEKAVIFEQMTNGVYVRMALMDMVLTHDS